jgi:hypothetical protein
MKSKLIKWLSLNDENEIEYLSIYKSMSILKLSLQPLLLQEHSKDLSPHTCHSVATIDPLTFNSDSLILRVEKKYQKISSIILCLFQ